MRPFDPRRVWRSASATLFTVHLYLNKKLVAYYNSDSWDSADVKAQVWKITNQYLVWGESILWKLGLEYRLDFFWVLQWERKIGRCYFSSSKSWGKNRSIHFKVLSSAGMYTFLSGYLLKPCAGENFYPRKQTLTAQLISWKGVQV